MKRLLLIVLMSAMVSGASAQFRGHHDGGFHRGGFNRGRSGVVIRGGLYAPFYPYGGFGWSYPFYGYYPYGYYYNRPSKLDIEITDIKHDYSDKIHSVKMDNTLNGKERREKVRELKQDRQDAIYQAKRDYYKS